MSEPKWLKEHYVDKSDSDEEIKSPPKCLVEMETYLEHVIDALYEAHKKLVDASLTAAKNVSAMRAARIRNLLFSATDFWNRYLSTINEIIEVVIAEVREYERDEIPACDSDSE